jgi:histidine ammonia-lyase
VPVVLTGAALTLDDVVAVARGDRQVELAPEAVDRMRRARAVVASALDGDAPVYGLSTGVGVRKRAVVRREEQLAFNRRLIQNHLVGQGPLAPEDVVRATMLTLANVLARGASTGSPELAERVVAALNERRSPEVRILGSIGQADLAPMGDLAHGIFGEAELGPGDGLALLNNNAFATGWAALALHDCSRLLDASLVAGALDLEAFGANLSIIDLAVPRERPYVGLGTAVAALRTMLAGTELTPRNLQDPLSFRCLPQVHGAALDALAFARKQLECELNAAQGNPLVDVEGGRTLSVANFDVLPLAAALDFMRIALAPVLTIANERMVKLLQAPLSGLPEGLSERPAVAEDSLSEYGPAGQALAAEARLLAQPVSFELASTAHAEGLEDRTTMAPLAARRLTEMVMLGERIVSVELLVACQAIDLRGHRLGEGTGRAYALVRERLPFKTEADPIPPSLEPLRELVRSHMLH